MVIGIMRIISESRELIGRILITFIWSCTNFLVPKTNGLLLSYKSEKAMLFRHGVGN